MNFIIKQIQKKNKHLMLIQTLNNTENYEFFCTYLHLRTSFISKLINLGMHTTLVWARHWIGRGSLLRGSLKGFRKGIVFYKIKKVFA